MKTKKQSFTDILHQFEHHYDVRTVFDDFLTMTICAFGQKLGTGKSYDEDFYLETIAKYKDNTLRNEFPKLLACLTNEMTQRLDSGEGWDVLGEYYELHLPSKGLSQFFTPWTICKFMAQSACEAARENKENGNRPLRILDPSCGSGRMLMAASRVGGAMQEYYGIDIDPTCVKMTTLNLFLSGLFRTETMWGNALARDDFRSSYVTSFLPFGLFRIQQKEQSKLWHILQNTWTANEPISPEPPNLNPIKYSGGSQLSIF